MELKKVTIEGVEYAVLEAGKPIVIHGDGKETPFDIPSAYNRMTEDGRENASLRTKLQDAEGKLKVYEGIDPKDARKALETVANLDQKKLIDAGEVEKVKNEIATGYEAKLSEQTERATKLEEALYAEMIGGSFARSKFISEKVAVPADMVQATFGRHFKIEDGRRVAYDALGNRITSRANPRELADFDEALEVLVAAYPYKDQILKGSGNSGSGSGHGAGSGGSAKTMSLSEFSALSPKDQAAKMAEGLQLTE